MLGKLEKNNIDEAWLVMDNTSLHKAEKVRSLVDQSRHTLIFLLPHSPMMNPIEEMFSKVKIYVRNILADPERHQNLTEIINESVETVTITVFNNYFLNMLVKLPSPVAGQPLE